MDGPTSDPSPSVPTPAPAPSPLASAGAKAASDSKGTSCVLKSILWFVAGVVTAAVFCINQHGCARASYIKTNHGESVMNTDSVSFDAQEVLYVDARSVPQERRRDVLDQYERDLKSGPYPHPAGVNYVEVQCESDRASGGAFTMGVRPRADKYYRFLINRSLPCTGAEQDYTLRWHCWFGVGADDGPMLQPRANTFDDMICNIAKRVLSDRARELLSAQSTDRTEPSFYYGKLAVYIVGDRVQAKPLVPPPPPPSSTPPPPPQDAAKSSTRRRRPAK